MSCVVELRGAATDLLHPVVREGLAVLRGALSAVGRALPRHVQKELEGFLGCGDPVNGFAWLHCAGCDHHRLVTFACKGGIDHRHQASIAAGSGQDRQLQPVEGMEGVVDRDRRRHGSPAVSI